MFCVRQTTISKSFIQAVTVGDGGWSRPIEIHAHDPLRYVGDMLGIFNLKFKRFIYSMGSSSCCWRARIDFHVALSSQQRKIQYISTKIS